MGEEEMHHVIIDDKICYSCDHSISGRFGEIFCGTYEKLIKVTILRIVKTEFKVELKELLIAQNNHQNVLRYFCRGENKDFDFLAIECTAGTLKDLIRGDNYTGPFFWDVKAVVRQITLGIEYLHQKKVMHRELKPSNIFISLSDDTRGPLMKLGNFGIRKIRNGLPLLKSVKGKGWLPPEAYLIDADFTYAMDLFGLGCVIACTLNKGRHPFGENREERSINIKTKQPMVLTVDNLDEHVDNPREAFDLIIRLTDFDPLKRIASASEVLRHLFFTSAPTVSEPSDQSLPNVTSLVICSRVEDHRILLDGKEVTVPSADTPVTPPQSRTSNWSPDVTDDENLISDLEKRIIRQGKFIPSPHTSDDGESFDDTFTAETSVDNQNPILDVTPTVYSPVIDESLDTEMNEIFFIMGQSKVTDDDANFSLTDPLALSNPTDDATDDKELNFQTDVASIDSSISNQQSSTGHQSRRLVIDRKAKKKICYFKQPQKRQKSSENAFATDS